ncbi:BREX-2 system phosphatase PglZ [Amycolatopsis saalfeldensis]|uniref:PglZ domain-containing protein n=1 Tax=Amycolatopsis saalfeldensis TaxID=394193 RepID=A0A1H8YPW6_9PSEU|nr:BREX-2 system phosphatase PglZ [Amycolatopsis saalfeldensis]SEP54169.1 PglZ domain-containing protein [Amycolatopsis saalfeldensis]
MSHAANENGVHSATDPMIRFLLDQAAEKRYRAGVLGIRAKAAWDGPEKFTHSGKQVVVAPCESTLAVWEALRGRLRDGWLVVLTPRTDDELGLGVLSHFAYQRLRTPDPWQAVRDLFDAVRLDPALYTRPDNRAVAAGLLGAKPGKGWPPAPGGVLTESHAFHAVLRSRLDMVDSGMEVDARAVFEWSAHPQATERLADFRDEVGDALADALIDWLARRCGLVEDPVRTLLRAGRVADLVPLGLIAGLLTDDADGSALALGLLRGKYGLGQLARDTLAAWYTDAGGLVTRALDRETVRRLAETATTRLRELDLIHLAARSEILPDGLSARISELASAVARALPRSIGSDPDERLVTDDLGQIEAGWDRVQEHHLAAGDRAVEAFGAVLRLLRWLAVDVHTGSSLGELIWRHLDSDAWVDSAVNEVARGSAAPGVGETLAAVLDLARRRRDAHDLDFAQALADTEAPSEPCVEQVLPEHVIPLANEQPVLLLVIDALSVGVAAELVSSLAASATGWVEYTLPGRNRRGGALAALPSLTDRSRCSLLSGELNRGAANAEKLGFAQLLKAHKLDEQAPLFHQKELDTVRAGLALAPSVQDAIADTTKHPLVAAVLNIVDDTLHHTDPIGARWNLDTITHLRALLEAARQAGRLVVLTSDHGHVLERRAGEYRKYPATHGNRARTTTPPPESDEVLVRGPRVLTEGHTAILAVNERLRYGPLNAGYHGGASPAEVIVPVIVLHAGDAPTGTRLTPVRNVEPAWWTRSPSRVQAPRPDRAPEGLFDLPDRHATAQTPDPDADQLAKHVIASKVFKRQKSIAGRVTITDEQIRVLLAVLSGAPAHRVPGEEAAAALGIATTRLYGAISTIKRVLDVEGYVVLSYEAESGQVALDVAMLREQFELKGLS